MAAAVSPARQRTRRMLREVEQAMEQRTVVAARQLTAETLALARAKQEEMRLLVFERYRDLLDTTEAVTQLKQVRSGRCPAAVASSPR